MKSRSARAIPCALAAILALECVPPARASGPVFVPDSGPPTYPDYKPLDHLWFGTRDLPDEENIVILTLGTMATLATLSLDDTVKSFFGGQNRLGGAQAFGNFWGSGIPEISLGVASLAYGLRHRDPHETDAAEALLEGLVANEVYTGLLKGVAHRTRPDGSDSYSFPSGHTSAAFALAATSMDMYGPAAGVPALALGAFTALSRVADNRHYLSDTVFGATLGYIVGHAYAIHHNLRYQLEDDMKELRSRLPELSFHPFFENRGNFGCTASVQF